MDAVGARLTELRTEERRRLASAAQIDEDDVAPAADVVEDAAEKTRVERRRIAGAAGQHEKRIGQLVGLESRQHDHRQTDHPPGTAERRVTVLAHRGPAALCLAWHPFELAGR